MRDFGHVTVTTGTGPATLTTTSTAATSTTSTGGSWSTVVYPTHRDGPDPDGVLARVR